MNLNTSYQTMESNAIRYMIKFVDEYEAIKNKSHKQFKFVGHLFKDKGICSQNFHKFYRRYKLSGCNQGAFLPQKRGPSGKYLDIELASDEKSIVSKVLEYRKKGANKYTISRLVSMDHSIKAPCSPSTVYRIFKAYGVSKLKHRERVETRKIVREKAGSLLNIDCHQLPKGIVKTFPTSKLYVLGAIDAYSRTVWVEVIERVKAIDVTFAMMDTLLVLNDRYGIQAEEVMTDNGSEFCGGVTTMRDHPFERLLTHFGIRHLKTKPYRPQTNGKIERFWRTFHEDVIEGCEFETLDQLKDAVLGYNFYYNEHRPHQGINGKLPADMLKQEKEKKED